MAMEQQQQQQQQWLTKLQQSGASEVDEKDSIMNCNSTTENLIHILDNKSHNNEDKCDRNVRLQQKFENEISEKSRTKIQAILSEVNNLSPVEKLLLYLKLPTDAKECIDPLKQPLNPLGSRSEISQTITWIRTHLEEDPEISLQKKAVYDEYKTFCGQNSIKNLSTADFGKVMKQVYPKVRPRRLGTRGNSQYCYSGLRKCIKLSAPLLPDLSDRPESTECISNTTSDLMAAAWFIVKEWSEVQLGCNFESIQLLAYHLVTKSSVAIGTKPATLITECIEKQLRDSNSNNSSSKHKEMTMQLQKKIQQKTEIKEQKRKMQSPRCDLKARKKCKVQNASSVTSSPTTTTAATTSITTDNANNNSEYNNSSPSQGLQSVCDKSLEFTKLQTLPDFSSFQKPVHGMGNNNSCDVQVVRDDNGFGNVGTDDIQSQQQHQQLHHQTQKIAIPRLPAKQSPVPSSSKRGRNAKYKAIQPKPEPCDIAYNPQVTTNVQCSTGDNGSQDDNDAADEGKKDVKPILKEEDICIASPLIETALMSRERLISVSKVSKDALDVYLVTENSQEHEEEIMKYFDNNNSGQATTATSTTITTDQDAEKLSQLRQLLEQDQHFVQQQQPAPQPMNNVNLTYRPTYIPKTDPAINMHAIVNNNNNNINVKRRVSFDTTQQLHDEPSVPPSPNTRRKHFNFTPISPGPHSPNGRQSKCSSTNASPFVSPRNTPVPRSRVNNLYGTNNQSQLITTRSKRQQLKSLRIKQEVELGFNAATTVSAPPSPKTNVLQDLLTNKTTYPSGGYVQNQLTTSNSLSNEVSLLLAGNNLPPPPYRSQSVPVRTMQYVDAYNFDSNPINNNNNNPPGETFVELNVNKLIHTIDENNTQLQEGNILDNHDEFDEQFQQQQPNQQQYFNKQSNFRWPTRSQSFEYDVPCMSNSYKLSQSCRSVPSTPVPQLQPSRIDAEKSISSRSYPTTPAVSETLRYNVGHDYLLNGQPIKEKQQPAATTTTATIESNDIGNYLTETDPGKIIYEEMFHDDAVPPSAVDSLIDNKTYGYDGPIEEHFETKSIGLDGGCDLIGTDYFKDVNGS